MLADLPKSIEKVPKEQLDKEILRAGMIAELDAISFYEQLAAMTDNKEIKKVLMDSAKEEKTHIAEFETMLFRVDKEQIKQHEEGRKEVEELTKKW